MPIRGAILRPSSFSRIYVYIDEYKAENLKGRLYLYNGSKEQYFNGILDMILKADSAFDKMAFPQSTFKTRTFTDKKHQGTNLTEKKWGSDMEHSNSDEFCSNIQHEDKATFIIHVKYRQNATWQGEIKWVEQNKTAAFRGELEMIKLMDSALSSGTEEKVEW